VQRHRRQAADARGGGGGERVRVAGELVRVGDSGQTGDLGEIPGLVAADTGLRGLDHGHRRSTRRRECGQRRGDHGLADARSGTGDDQDAHGRRV
jgi:hypothetical protein